MARGRNFSGARLREIREANRLLQHDLADRLRKRGFGTTQVTVSRWENGQAPRSSVMAALADELGVKVDELYQDEEESEAASMAPLAAGNLLETLAEAVEALREKRATFAELLRVEP